LCDVDLGLDFRFDELRRVPSLFEWVVDAVDAGDPSLSPPFRHDDVLAVDRVVGLELLDHRPLGAGLIELGEQYFCVRCPCARVRDQAGSDRVAPLLRDGGDVVHYLCGFGSFRALCAARKRKSPILATDQTSDASVALDASCATSGATNSGSKSVRI